MRGYQWIANYLGLLYYVVTYVIDGYTLSK